MSQSLADSQENIIFRSRIIFLAIHSQLKSRGFLAESVKKMPLKKVDLILLTGDLGNADIARKMFFDNIKREKKGLKPIKYKPLEEKRAFMQEYNSTIVIMNYLSKFAPVYTIYGNVENSDSGIKKMSKKIKLKLPLLEKELSKIKNAKVINNKKVNFKGLSIIGLKYFGDTSWVKEFKPSNYKKSMEKAKKQTDKIKRILKKFGKADILIFHQPPYNVLDKVTSKFAPKQWIGKHAGSKILLDYIKKNKPKYVFCGHIHEAEGVKKIGKTTVYNLGVAGYKTVEM